MWNVSLGHGRSTGRWERRGAALSGIVRNDLARRTKQQHERKTGRKQTNTRKGASTHTISGRTFLSTHRTGTQQAQSLPLFQGSGSSGLAQHNPAGTSLRALQCRTPIGLGGDQNRVLCCACLTLFRLGITEWCVSLACIASWRATSEKARQLY